MNDKIDFVVTWVDGSDPEWQREKNAYFTGKVTRHTGENRYRDWGLMRYWFRGVERFAPWVNNVWFVTCGHLPEWLNTAHPKLKIVSHRDFMPASALPTFNSNAIELCINKIDGLSDKFVYFNDDTFLIDRIDTSLYFHKGLPCDCAALDVLLPFQEYDHIVVNDMIPINQRFSKAACLRENFWKWYYPTGDFQKHLRSLVYAFLGRRFSQFQHYHLPTAFLKSEFDDMWERFPERMSETVHHRFRCNEDNSHCLIRNWRLASGQFHPKSQKYGILINVTNDDRIRQAADVVRSQKRRVICINDDYKGDRLEEETALLRKSFEKILPVPSEFEK